MRMKKVLVAAILSMSFAVSVRAGVAGDIVRIEIYPSVGTKSNPVSLVFTGAQFGADGLSLLDKGAVAKAAHPGVAAILAMDEAVRSGDREKYIQFWDDAGRSSTRDLYAGNPQLWNRAVELFRTVQERRLMALLQYGDYWIAEILDKDATGKLMPNFVTLRNDGNTVRRTNDLKSDAAFNALREIRARKLIEQSGGGR